MFPFVSLLPRDGNWREQCLILFWFHNFSQADVVLEPLVFPLRAPQSKAESSALLVLMLQMDCLLGIVLSQCVSFKRKKTQLTHHEVNIFGNAPLCLYKPISQDTVMTVQFQADKHSLICYPI